MNRFRPSLRIAACIWLLGVVASPMALAARTHVVQRGDTLSSIATAYGVSLADLERANNLRRTDLIRRGQTLVIPDNPSSAWTGAHLVGAGETLSSVAAAYGVTVGELAAANNLRNADLVQRGSTLKVPRKNPPAVVEAPASPPPAAADSTASPTTHTVRSGETLSSIAAAYGVTVRDLAQTNRLRDADRLFPGQKIAIPQGAPAFIEHRVARGETLGAIASRYKVALADIRASNTLKNANRIKPGQVLRIPASDTSLTEEQVAAGKPPPAPKSAAGPGGLPAAIVAAIETARVKPGRWKSIVIHHSATNVGSGASMDRFHREERHMENGLAYHFVIGNGNGMTDGSIFVGRRWNEQLDGGHLAIPAINQVALGICLVGDFEKRAPSYRQMANLEALVRALLKKTRLSADAVTIHRLAHPKHTLCPGKHFPFDRLKEQLVRN